YLIAYDPKNPAKKVWLREEKAIAEVVKVFEKLQVDTGLLEEIKQHIRDTDHTERDFVRRSILELQKEQNQLRSRSDTLMDLLLDGAIERGEYDQKRDALRAKQAKVAELIEAHEAGDDNFKEALISLITMAASAKEQFLGSNTEEKRILLNCVFSNLTLNGS